MNAVAMLDEIAEQMEALAQQREQVLNHAAADLGSEMEVVTIRYGWKHSITEGSLVCVVETIMPTAVGGAKRVVQGYGGTAQTRIDPPTGIRFQRGCAGPLALPDHLTVDLGTFTAAIVQGSTVILTRERGAGDEEARLMSLRRLRARAAREGMKVRVRDLDVALVAPTNDVVHRGTVLTAMGWLIGIEDLRVALDKGQPKS